MKKLIPFLAVLLVFNAADVFAFSCNGKFISIGMREYDVLDRCGEPAHTESWEESEYINPYPPYPQTDAGGRILVVPGTIVILWETWVYNLGPNRFMPILTFRNAKLVKIEQGNYGY